jgi:predicted NAD/FAD-binding protein
MRIAIVGSGVSGLVAARLLHTHHEITVFEADDRIGGHVHTWDVESGGRPYAVDSGFIVYNERNYPNFTRLLAQMGVATQPSTMSFSVRHDRAGIEYNGSTLSQLFVQRRNLLRPEFLRMVAQILRFNRGAVAAARAGGATLTLGDLLDQGGFSQAFREWYLLPMGSAIWSIPLTAVLEMPAQFFADFFHNHGMLTVDDRPQWRVVVGGSARYVEALVAPFRDRVRLGHAVRRVERTDDGVMVNGEPFDRVVMACHSDQALRILADPTDAERAVLSAFPYQVNDALLHTDTRILPRAQSAWGAWNYRVANDPWAPAVVTYNMNMLQSLDAPETFCVTLNGADGIDPAKVRGVVRYHHPVFTTAGSAARARRSEVSGPNRTHFCGAYWGNGFHEDGVASALEVVREVDAASRVDALALLAR